MSVTPILALLPESQYTWTLDHQLQPYIAQMPTEVTTSVVVIGGTPTTVHTYAPGIIPANEIAITCCAAKDGNVWVLYDDTDTANRSILRKFDKTTGVLIVEIVPFQGPGDVGPPVLLGDYGSYKSLMEADCGNLISVDRNTREVVRIKTENQDDSLTPGVGVREFPLSILTSDGTTATATRISHGIPVGVTTVTISGAEQVDYNGTFAATVINSDTFTYPLAGTFLSPATGFIIASFANLVTASSLGEVVQRYGLIVTPLDAAINAAGTRLLYLEDAFAKLYDLEHDAFIRIIPTGRIPCFGSGGDGGDGGGVAPCSDTTGPPTGPPWFLDLLTANGATNCWDDTVLAAMESTLNGMGYYLQRSSGCDIRGRLYYDPGGAVTSALCPPFLDATHFNRYADTTRADGGWEFVANF